jgi:hypothetical protein
MTDLPTVIAATGALGTSAFGIVQAAKIWSPVGEAGFDTMVGALGTLTSALDVAYGHEWQRYLRGAYRGDGSSLRTTLRQGVRVGLTADNAGTVCAFLGAIDATALRTAVAAAQQGHTLTADQSALIGRFELAADARIEAALALAGARYKGTLHVSASVVAIGLALAAAATIPEVSIVQALIVGIAAVPLAPISADIASGLSAATRALKRR